MVIVAALVVNNGASLGQAVPRSSYAPRWNPESDRTGDLRGEAEANKTFVSRQ
jgi:hypothetical protein